MKLVLALRLVVRVLLSLAGVLLALVASVCVGPAGGGRGVLRSVVPTDPIRAAKLLRVQYPGTAPVVLSPAAGWQLILLSLLARYRIGMALGALSLWLAVLTRLRLLTVTVTGSRRIL